MPEETKRRKPSEDKLSTRERLFVNALCKGMTNRAAAMAAGCTHVSAPARATRWLEKPAVQKAIEEFHSREAWRTSIDRERIRRRLLAAALADNSQVFGEDWELKEKSEIPKAARAMVLSARKWSNPDQGSGCQVKLANPLEAMKAYLKLFPAVAVGGGIDLQEVADEVESEMDDLLEKFEN